MAKGFLVIIGLLLVPNFSFAYKYGTATIGEVKIDLEICETAAERNLGLGGRRELPDYQGMLFEFDHAGEHLFWMKGMLIAIDIIWLSQGRVVHIEERVPPPANILLTDLPTYGHEVIADAVLEVAAGFSSRINLQLGDLVEITVNSD